MSNSIPLTNSGSSQKTPWGKVAARTVLAAVAGCALLIGSQRAVVRADAQTPQCPCNILGSLAPEEATSNNEGRAVEVGLRFQSQVDGYITALRFYRGEGAKGRYTGNLWTADGKNLARAVFADSKETGWQQVTLTAPVKIKAQTTYIASYHTSAGTYVSTTGYFTDASLVNPPLVALANGFDGPNGVYKYGASSFPDETYQSANYWVDVVFTTTASDQLPPVATEVTPSEGATGIASDARVTIAFSEAVAASSISVVLRESENETIGARVSYDADSRTLSVTPSSPLKQGVTYTVVVNGVVDTAGNRMGEPLTWTFSTIAATPAAPSAASPAAPASPTPVSPSAPRCDLRSETIVTSTENGTVTVVTNFKGVQGLIEQTVVLSGGEGGGAATTIAIPAWLQAAYNGNVEAIYRDLESGTLANRCAS